MPIIIQKKHLKKRLRAAQDQELLEVMEKLIDKDREKFFLNLAQAGVKLPYDFDIDQLKKYQQQDDPMNAMTRQIKAFQE